MMDVDRTPRPDQDLSRTRGPEGRKDPRWTCHTCTKPRVRHPLINAPRRDTAHHLRQAHGLSQEEINQALHTARVE